MPFSELGGNFMSAEKPVFFDRVAGAFTSASLAFLPGFVLVGTQGVFSGHVHPLSWLDQVSSTVGLCLAIILAAVFVIAYPVERWLVKPEQSVWRMGGIYVAVIFIFGILLSAASSFGGGYWGIILLFATPIAAITAFAGRMIYSRIAKNLKTNRAIAVVLALLIALPIALPDFREMSYKVSDFYPDVQTGEISRGTWDVNEVDGSAGTHFSNTGLQAADNVEYVILWDCEKKFNQKYSIYVQGSDYKINEETEVVCSMNHDSTVPVVADISSASVKVMISPAVGDEPTTDSDAYAILMPAN
jgi:hypothetical protein